MAKIATRVAHDTRVLFVGKDVVANGRGRLVAFAASLIVGPSSSKIVSMPPMPQPMMAPEFQSTGLPW